MEYVILINGFKVQRSGKKFKYIVNVLGQGEFSMLSNGTIQKNIKKAKKLNNEDIYFATIENACIKILRYNDFYFDSIELISFG